MLDKQFIRGLVIFVLLLLGGCATENADWGTSYETYAFKNSMLLKKGIKSTSCIAKQKGSNYYWDHYPSKIRKVYKIGAIVHPHNQSIRRRPWGYSTGHEFGPTTISISIIPYIITDSGKFYLLPDVSEKLQQDDKRFLNYYPACQANSYQLGFSHPKFYPSVLLKVENPSDLKMLEQGLNSSLYKRKSLEFTVHPITLKSAMNMDLLLQTLLQQKQAKFLDNYDFTVEVKMEGSKKGLISFKAGDKLKKITQELDKLKQVCSASQKPIISGQSSGKKLIVVSLSNSRKLKSQTHAIQKSFIKVLSELKKNHSKTQFALLKVHSGRKIAKVLSSQELQRLPIKGENSLRSSIELAINFGAKDLKALADLSLVDSILQDQPSIKNILYLTDNKRMIKTLQDIPSQQLGVPLVWHKKGIALTVLTIKECQVWEYMEAKCVAWNSQNDLIRELKTFLSE